MEPASASLMSEEEASLWMEFQSGARDAARLKLFELHVDFARGMARRALRERSRGDLDLQDLQQMACSGLLESINRYDPDRGVPFRAFASRRIIGSLSDGIAKFSEVREQMSARARARQDRLRSVAVDSGASLNAHGALDALADIAMSLALGFMLEDTALFVDDEETPHALTSRATAYESAEWRELTLRLEAELSALPDREQIILRHHYLRGLSFDLLAGMLGVTKGRVSQIHRGALETLRKRLGRRGHSSFER